jgi:hypothetical protein
MSYPDWRKKPKIGVELQFGGDHFIHRVRALDDDLPYSWDQDSLVLTLHLTEWEAKDLFWDLLEIIPQLRKDRH